MIDLISQIIDLLVAPTTSMMDGDFIINKTNQAFIDPITASIIGGGAVKLIGGLFGASKRSQGADMLIKDSKNSIRDIAATGDKYLSSVSDTMKSAYGDLVKLPELDIDTSMQDSAYADAQRAAESSFGRSAGEEIARDVTRQSTADSIARARTSGASVADLLGFTGQAEARERDAMQGIDAQSMVMRENRISDSLNRLAAAGAQRADFYNKKEMSEFQSDLNKSMTIADFRRQAGMTIADIGRQNSLDIISARTNLAQARAAKKGMQAGNTEAILGGLGQSAMDFGFMEYRNKFLTDTVSGGSDKKR